MMDKKPSAEQIEMVLNRLQGIGANPYSSKWCQKNTGHETLQPVERDGTVYFVCPNCDYEEELGPEYFEDE